MQDFEYADFISEERIVPDEKLGKYNLPFILFPFIFLFIFVINFGASLFLEGIESFFSVDNIFLILTGGFLTHEFIHFIVWQSLSRFSFHEFRVGIRWNSITPVIGCQRPMKTWQFMSGLIAPFLLMGVLPLIFAFYFINTWLLFSAVLFMAWASADLLTFILIWNAKGKTYVEMHRTKLGAIVFHPKKTNLVDHSHV